MHGKIETNLWAVSEVVTERSTPNRTVIEDKITLLSIKGRFNLTSPFHASYGERAHSSPHWRLWTSKQGRRTGRVLEDRPSTLRSPASDNWAGRELGTVWPALVGIQRSDTGTDSLNVCSDDMEIRLASPNRSLCSV